MICEECDEELCHIQNFRKELILKQRKLIEIVRGKEKQLSFDVNPQKEMPKEEEYYIEELIVEEEVTDDEDHDMQQCKKKKPFNFNNFVKHFFLDYCDLCGWKADLKESMEAHMETHIQSLNQLKSSKTISCHCGKIFRTRAQFNDHKRRIHETVRDCQCQYCGRYYAKRELNIHVKRVHMKGKRLKFSQQRFYFNFIYF